MCDRFIVPTAVLRRLAEDESIPAESRQAMRESVAVERMWRDLRRRPHRRDAGESAGNRIQRRAACRCARDRSSGNGV